MTENSVEPEDRATKQRDSRRRQIVAAAKEVFAELGYHNASISELIQRAGIARGTFYLYFDNKRQVFDSILNEALSELDKRILAIIVGPQQPSARAQLRNNFIRVLSYLLEDQALTQMLLNHGLTPDASAADRVGAFYQGVIIMIRASLAEGVERGLLRTCHSEIVASALFGAIRGMVDYLMSEESTLPIEEAADELIVFVLHGVADSEAWITD